MKSGDPGPDGGNPFAPSTDSQDREPGLASRWPGLGVLSLITLILTGLWLALFIGDIAAMGPIETFEQALAYGGRLDWRYSLNYANAALITVAATAWMAGLYAYCKPILPRWSVIGVAFVPVYCTLNLLSYLSQITVIPQLLALQQTTRYEAVTDILLRMMVHQAPGSAVGFFNSLAYAVLGIPSILFGLALWGRGGAQRVGGALLALNGVACIAGVIGSLVGSPVLAMGAAAGGAIFFLSLFPLSWCFLREV